MEDIWILADDRPGTSSQAIGLAERLGLKFEVKNIKYNVLGMLPNFLLNGRDGFIDKKKSDLLEPPYPRLIISAGRRTAMLALNIKDKSPTTKVVQLMRPGFRDKDFDLIIIPQHDKYNINSNNTLRIIGAINKINAEGILKYKDEGKILKSKKFIAALIGGSVKRYNVTEEEASNLIEKLIRISNNHALEVYITFSRRTPESIKNLFYASFPEECIYDPELKKDYNPYLDMLVFAKYIVVTSDSISMCSEAVSTGNPTYIYRFPYFNSAKHNYFLQQLLDLNLAKRLNDDILTEYYNLLTNCKNLQASSNFILLNSLNKLLLNPTLS